MNDSIKKAFAEMLGVMVFVISIFAFNSNPSIHNFVFSGTLVVMILITSQVSGAYLNPVVTLFFYLRKTLKLSSLIQYWIAQLLGAFLGIYIAYALSGRNISPIPRPSEYSDSGAFLGEVLATAMLIVIITRLLVTNQNSAIPYAVGIWVLAASTFTITGAQANPAVTFARILRDGLVSEHLWVLLAEIVGMIVALFYVWVFDSDKAKAR